MKKIIIDFGNIVGEMKSKKDSLNIGPVKNSQPPGRRGERKGYEG